MHETVRAAMLWLGVAPGHAGLGPCTLTHRTLELASPSLNQNLEVGHACRQLKREVLLFRLLGVSHHASSPKSWR